MSTTLIDRPPTQRARPWQVEAVIGVSAAAAAGAVLWSPLAYLAVVVAVVFAAAAVDARSGRIPNALVAGIVAAAAVRGVRIVVAGDAPAVVVARDALVGVVLSGAVTLFVVWLLRPALVGGGDWKLLGAIGAALGVVDPLAAAVVGVVAVVVQLAAALWVRRRQFVFGPALAIGSAAGAAAALWLDTGGGAW